MEADPMEPVRPACSRVSSQNVCKLPVEKSVEYNYSECAQTKILPFPLAVTVSFLDVNQLSLPAETNKSAVSCEIWILFGSPVDSILLAVFMVSPNN